MVLREYVWQIFNMSFVRSEHVIHLNVNIESYPFIIFFEILIYSSPKPPQIQFCFCFALNLPLSFFFFTFNFENK